MREGYHVMEREVLKERKISTHKPVSIIEFLKMVRNEEVEQFEDYTVYGLEDLLLGVEDGEEIIKYVHELLREKAPSLVNTGSMFQFIIERGDIEIWSNKPSIKLRDGNKFQLHNIFGLMESPEDDPNWFWHQLNVES
ncbi:hypothetical protein AKJ57_04390 [candidate division MSBL1 archaeon SCGC-AAA259A05]|uniref:DUF8076 domain-containing protein n=1 Tax=candidate division MSBL1 archaeon SCGC-AAA259A05 TaxID=1698259 RepID=A0A133U7M3_9EURY|nr:hypothetical protein AKJ57_04390 [candidate division MSBL1 archaeon SCGC-AAA259A05]